MSNPTLTSRLAPEERTLLRQIGAALSQILQGQRSPVPESDRRDELGLLAALANRVATEIISARERDAQAHLVLEQKLVELNAAYRQKEQLLATVRALSSPVLHIHPGVILIPLVADIDHERSQQIIMTLLDQVVAVRARVVILDVTGTTAGDPLVAQLLARATTAARLLGAGTILSGMSAQFARLAAENRIDFASIQCRSDLHSALAAAVVMLRPGRSG